MTEPEFEHRLERAREMIDRLRAALKPFAEYAGAAPLPDQLATADQIIITRGSQLARLTMRDCNDAAFALMETGVRV